MMKLWICAMAATLACIPGVVWAQADPLYAGTSNPGVVYQYQGGSSWVAVSPPLGDAILCLAQYEGDLYAGALSWGDYGYSGGRVYRHDGGGQWSVVLDRQDYQVASLLVYRRDLYAGAVSWPARLYRYEGGTSWTVVAEPEDWSGFRSMWVAADGYLYLGDYGWDIIGRYDAAGFGSIVDLGGSCIWDFSDRGGALHAAAFAGRLHRSRDGLSWITVIAYDNGAGNLWEIEQFEGHLYIGDQAGRLRRMDSEGNLSLLWTAPSSVIAMLAYGHDCVYLGTGREEGYWGEEEPDGRVYMYTGSGAPQSISDRLGDGVQCLFYPYVFPDIRCEHWAYEEIEGCREAGIVDGYPDGHFYSTRSLTRDQMAVFVARGLMGGDENVPSGPAEPSYPDVDVDHWAYDHIECATEQSIVQGYTDGRYHPDYPLTRDQMAIYIARVMCGGIGQVPVEPCWEYPFPDVPCDFWARPDIQYIGSAGVSGGYADGLYHPERVCTRAQMSVFLARAFGLVD